MLLAPTKNITTVNKNILKVGDNKKNPSLKAVQSQQYKQKIDAIDIVWCLTVVS